MKIKSFLMSITFLCIFNSNLFAAVSGRGHITRHLSEEYTRDQYEKGLLDIPADATEEQKEAAIKVIRFLDGPLADIDFAHSAFYAADYFFLGAGRPVAPIADTGSSALSRAKITRGAKPENYVVEFVPMAPEKVLLNGENDKNNPLYKSNITNLNLMSRFPLATNERPAAIIPHPAGFLGDNKHVYLIDDPELGGSVKTNDVAINDAAGAATDGVIGLAASSNLIFAAVRPDGGVFGEANSGIALLSQDENKLKPKNAQTGAVGNLPFQINLDAGQLLAIGQNATVGGFGDMYWDPTLQRLFIGLDDVQHAGANSGAVSLLVGRIGNAGELIIQPSVALNVGNFTADTNEFIFGFYRTDAVVTRSSTYKIRTMHTSTGKSYLIVNGGIGNVANNNHNEFYALPLLQKSDAGAGAVEANVGKVADKNNLTILPAAAVNMSQNNEAPVIVGVDVLSIQTTQEVQDMFVQGDSVYVSVAGARGVADREAGIFRSTAIFAQDGAIRAWTPWQRVMGSVDTVYGAGLDTVLGNYWYLTDNGGANVDTVKVTQWGKSVAQPGMHGNGLVGLLSTQFTQENAGVHQIFNFDEFTPSLARNAAENRLSMIVTTGFGKVSIIQTGNANPFTPTQAQFQDGVNVFNFTDNLDEIGPICCAQLSRGRAANVGWLFVGGDGGLAVLRAGATGNGWDGDPASVNPVDLANIYANFTFKKIGNFSQVRKLVASGDLYVMTADGLQRVLMDANKFQDVGAAPLNSREITPPPGALLDMIIFYRNNVAPGDTRLLVATTQGLFYSNAIVDADVDKTGINAPVWTAVPLRLPAPVGTTTLSGQPVVHLDFISTQKGGFTTNGNLYALAADLSLNLATVYRFDVDGAGNINPITESSGSNDFYAIGELRSNFVTDGSFGYHMLSKHFGQTSFLKKINMGTDQTAMRSLERAIDLDLENNVYNIGRMVQNTASGAWVVPGDWGIRVNE